MGGRRRTGPTTLSAATVFERAGGLCEVCGGAGSDIHHRKPRGAGGTRDGAINALSNLTLLCRRDHARVESERALAYERGWLVHSWDEPGLVPFLRLGRFCLFDDVGGFEYVV